MVAKINQKAIDDSSFNALRPLAGKRIVITRARGQAESLAQRIEERGGEVVEFPTIEIQPPESYAALDGAIEKIRTYDWLIFTSVNGVESFLKRMQILNKPINELVGIKVGAIGPETAKRLESAGVQDCLVPKQYQAEGFLEILSPELVRGKRVLIPRAAKARDILPETLKQWGAQVDVVEAYRTAIPVVDSTWFKDLLRTGGVDMVTFTSSSTVTNFVQLFAGQNLAQLLAGVAIACIGPITRQTVEELGGRAAVVAEEFTIPALVQATVDYFARQANLDRDHISQRTTS
jgi:uroporphyrinogen III methyltransferase/synthase